MITSISLQNYKSFGELQKVPLEPITVIVGPNNCGKSGFLGVGRFVRAGITGNLVSVRRAGGAFFSHEAIEDEGGERFLFHRPPFDDGNLRLGWEASEAGSYEVTLRTTSNRVLQIGESLVHHELGDSVIDKHSGDPFMGLRIAATPGKLSEDVFTQIRPIYEPLMNSHMVKLSLEALRQDAEVVSEPQIGIDGSGLAAVLGLWRGSDPERIEDLESFLRATLPEIKRALVLPSPDKAGFQRLWIEQADGERFDAPHVSDGILIFTAMAMHALSVPEHAILFVEEPELYVHPRRLSDLVDLFRRLANERKCQFVIATHSPVLLNQFRDEPEAIVLFQRGNSGTRVRRLSELPDLVQVLYKTDPGDMLANGFFNERLSEPGHV